jgi:hypothetical protein
MSVRAVIARAARRSQKKVLLIRYKPGIFRGGVYHAEILWKRPIDASVQPLAEDKVVVTPDNLVRISSMLQVFSADEILAADKASNQPADELEIDGRVYSVDSVENWMHRNLMHYEAIVSRKVDT